MLLVLALGLLLPACSRALTPDVPTPTSEPRQPMPALTQPGDFHFVFRYSPCGPWEDTIDTATGTLVHLSPGSTRPTTLLFELNDAELLTIYHKMDAINFWGYPAEFSIPYPYRIGMHTPAAKYHLGVQIGTATHEVTWRDDALTEQPYAPADRLRELMSMIRGLIRSRPEYRQLPTPSAYCA